MKKESEEKEDSKNQVWQKDGVVKGRSEKKNRRKFVKIKREGKSKCDDRISTEMERKYKKKR